MAPLTFVIVGSGWRAAFYVRIAKRWPQCFRLLYVLCRSAEKAERLRREWDVPTTASADACAAARPDFVVVAAARAANFALTREWLARGFAVLAETPAAESETELEELWALHRQGAKLQIAEQYGRYPLIAAGLRAVRQGLLGTPQAVTLSLAHDYHAASLIRHMLDDGLDAQAQAGPGWRLPAFTVCGASYRWPVEETDSRFGPIADGRVGEHERTCLTLAFANGKLAFYDFDGVQYHSFIRTRHINVRGLRGEWNDTTLRYVDDAHCPQQRPLCAALDPARPALADPDLAAMGSTWHPAVQMENWQDEYAIATLMQDMRQVLATGRGGYPLAEALEDAYTWLLMREAAAHPDTAVTSRPHSWQQGGEAEA